MDIQFRFPHSFPFFLALWQAKIILAQKITASTSDPAITYSGAWELTYGKMSHISMNPGDTATFQFDGTSIQWRSTKSWRQGVEKVTLDGQSWSVDTTWPNNDVASDTVVVFEMNNLAPKLHTLTVTKISPPDRTAVVWDFIYTPSDQIPIFTSGAAIRPSSAKPEGGSSTRTAAQAQTSTPRMTTSVTTRAIPTVVPTPGGETTSTVLISESSVMTIGESSATTIGESTSTTELILPNGSTTTLTFASNSNTANADDTMGSDPALVTSGTESLPPLWTGGSQLSGQDSKSLDNSGFVSSGFISSKGSNISKGFDSNGSNGSNNGNISNPSSTLPDPASDGDGPSTLVIGLSASAGGFLGLLLLLLAIYCIRKKRRNNKTNTGGDISRPIMQESDISRGGGGGIGLQQWQSFTSPSTTSISQGLQALDTNIGGTGSQASPISPDQSIASHAFSNSEPSYFNPGPGDSTTNIPMPIINAPADAFVWDPVPRPPAYASVNMDSYPQTPRTPASSSALISPPASNDIPAVPSSNPNIVNPDLTSPTQLLSNPYGTDNSQQLALFVDTTRRSSLHKELSPQSPGSGRIA